MTNKRFLHYSFLFRPSVSVLCFATWRICAIIPPHHSLVTETWKIHRIKYRIIKREFANKLATSYCVIIYFQIYMYLEFKRNFCDDAITKRATQVWSFYKSGFLFFAKRIYLTFVYLMSNKECDQQMQQTLVSLGRKWFKNKIKKIFFKPRIFTQVNIYFFLT